MAHWWRKGPRRLAAGSAAVLAWLACDAGAIALGEAQVRSSLGDTLDLRIPVSVGSGESIEPGCFSLVRDPAGDIPRLTGARVSVERSAAGAHLRVESRTAVNEPAFVIGIVASCPGQSGEYRRDYSLLLDPPAAGRAPPSQAAAPATARTQPQAASLRAIAATLIARIGDTLESIANAIFPRNRAAKKSYIEALRDTNPTLAPLGENDPIPVDTPIALPDLRTFAKARPPRSGDTAPDARVPRAPRQASAPASGVERPGAPPTRTSTQPSAPARAQPTPPAAAPPTAPAPTPARAAPAAPAASKAAPRRTRDGEAFVLRLSSAEVDLTRSRSFDDGKRAQLRERQLVLDADDQVAAVLALRHSVKQLESRVAELQLKLAGMPSSFPPPKAAPVPAPAPPVTAPPPVTATTAPATTAAPAPAATATPAPAATPTPTPATPATPTPAPTVAPPVASTQPPAATPAQPSTTPAVTTPPAPPDPPAKTAPSADRPVVRRAGTEREWLNYALWVLAALLLFAAAYLAWRLWQRRRESAEYEEEEPVAAADDQIVVADEHDEPPPLREEISADGRRIIDADVELPTRLSNDSEDLRRRYIEERFPEIMKGAIVLEDANSVVKGARLFYEDGAIARAVELLQYAIERNPAEMKTWLALFEIFRLERLSGEFAALAQRFRQHHGAGPYWPKVQYFGREIDPGNALYQQASVNTFETIGPAQARVIAAENAAFDPIAENWLGAPMDFENEVLANDLRKAVMAEAGITDTDLIPNPMPALRNVEMFTVA